MLKERETAECQKDRKALKYSNSQKEYLYIVNLLC